MMKAKPIYPFERVAEFIKNCRQKHIKFYDFGFGSPRGDPPRIVIKTCCTSLNENKNRGYPTTIGESYIRESIAQWMKKRFNLKINPASQISVTNGAKGGMFRFSLSILKQNDYVLVPTPGYPIMATVAEKSYAKIYYLPLREKNYFLPDFNNIPESVLKAAKLMWINFPNNPTSAEAPRDYLVKLVNFCQKNNIILAADEVYIDLYANKKPSSILEISCKNIVSFFSLTKSYNMADYRIGWIAGDKNLIQKFQREEAWVESGVPSFIQDALVAALQNTEYINDLREDYKKKNQILVNALSSLGLEKPLYPGCFYIWQKAPQGQTGIDFYKKLLKLDIISIPGQWLTAPSENVSEEYVRFALVSSLEDTEYAANLIKQNASFLIK